MTGSAKLMTPGGGGVVLQPASSIASDVTVSVPSVNATLLTDSTGVLNIGSGQVYKDVSGNVGIGTSSPNRKLQVVSSAATDVLSINNTSSSGYATQLFTNDASNTLFLGMGGSAAGAWSNVGVFGTGTNIPQLFVTNNIERMRIDSSGKLLVNTTSDVIGNNPAFIVNGTNFSNCSEFRWTGTSSFYNVMVANGNGFLGGINTTGSTTSYTNLSDYRVKENIKPMVGAVDKIALLKPCTFVYKTDGKDGQGFIAHELQEVFPDAVVGEKDAVDAEGKPIYQGIDTSFLVATLTKAIQELNAKLDAATARITELEAK